MAKKNMGVDTFKAKKRTKRRFRKYPLTHQKKLGPKQQHAY